MPGHRGLGGVEDLAQLLNREFLPFEKEQDAHPGRVGQGLEDPLQGGGRHGGLVQSISISR